MLELLTVPNKDLRAGDVLHRSGDLVIGPPVKMTDTYLWVDLVSLEPTVMGTALKPGPRTLLGGADVAVEIQRAANPELPLSAPAAHVGRGGAPAARESGDEIAWQMQQWFHAGPRVCDRDSLLCNVPAEVAARALALGCAWIDEQAWADAADQGAAERMTVHEVIACVWLHYVPAVRVAAWDDLITSAAARAS